MLGLADKAPPSKDTSAGASSSSMPPLTTTEIINGSSRSPARSPRTKGAQMTKKTPNDVVESTAADQEEAVKVPVDPLNVEAGGGASIASSNTCTNTSDEKGAESAESSDPANNNYVLEEDQHDRNTKLERAPSYDAALVDDYNPPHNPSSATEYGVPLPASADMNMPGVPSAKMQRRRSSLSQTACAEIGEMAAEYVQKFLDATQLDRDENEATNEFQGSADTLDLLDSASHPNPHEHGALVDHPARLAPARAQTASPTLPGQSYKSYIDLYMCDGAGGVERSTSLGSRRRGSSSASSALSQASAGSNTNANPNTALAQQRCYLPVRTFHMDEIIVGRLLGSGTFNDVYEAFLAPKQRSVYGRQTSLPTLLPSARGHVQTAASLTSTTGTLNASFSDLDVDRQELQGHQQQGQAQAQDATSASSQPTYGQMPLNDEPSSRSVRLRPSSAKSEPRPRYVLKHLKDVVMEDYDTFLTGAVDLAVEAKMLSHLHHPNIIRLEGVTAGSLSDALSTGVVGGYFLVLEMLEISLLDQIVKWKEEKKIAKQLWRFSVARLLGTLSSTTSLTSLADRDDNDSKVEGKSNGESAGSVSSLPPPRTPRRRGSGTSVATSSSFRSFDCEEDQSTTAAAPPPTSRRSKEPMFLYHRRLTVAAEIAAGFAYLHRKNILYRDAKPQNIGLDHNGTVKIFDMGLAKELHEGDKRKHTGNCGTKRYMSPECGRFDHYGLSSDVYSFSLLLWEILALERPYAKLTAKDFSEKVYFGTMRPTLPSKWPAAVRELLPDCWTNEKNERPTMETVANVLRNMAEEAKPFTPRYATSTSSRPLNDGMSDISSVVSEAPSNQGAVAGGKARPDMVRRSSMTRGSFRLGGSSRSLAGGKSKVSSNEGVVVPKNIRKWLEAQEKQDTNLDNETMRVARTGGASRAAAARRNSANIYKREGDSIEQKDSFNDSQEMHDPLAVSTGVNERNPVTNPGADGAMMFPARAISRRASTRDF